MESLKFTKRKHSKSFKNIIRPNIMDLLLKQSSNIKKLILETDDILKELEMDNYSKSSRMNKVPELMLLMIENVDK